MKKKIVILPIILSSFLSISGISLNLINETHAADETVFINDDFTTIGINASHANSYYHVTSSSSGSSHGLVPGASWGANITAGNGYLIYKVSANENKAFESLKLDMSILCRSDLTMSDGSSNQNTAINVYYSLDGSSFESKAETYSPWTGSSSFQNKFLDLTEYAVGSSSIFIKVEMVHKEGTVSLSSTGTKISSIKFSGTEKQSSIAFVEKADTFTNTIAADCKFDDVKDLGGFNNSNGLVPTAAWGATVTTVKQSYLIYSLKTPAGPTFKSLSISVNGRIWSGGEVTIDGEPATTAGCSIKYYISTDKTNFGQPVKEFEATGSSPTNYNYTDNIKCVGQTSIYIKIEVNHPVCIASLAQCGVRLYGATISGSYDTKDLIDSTPLDKTVNLANEYSNYEYTGEFSIMNSSGKKYLYANGNKATIVLPIECDGLYKFHSVSFSQLIRCTTYGSVDPIYNAVKYSVSKDNADYDELLVLDTDQSWARTNVVLDLTPVLKGEHKGYVKVEIDWSGKAYSHDWIAIGDYSLTGDLVERTNFDITYLNMDNAANNPSNPYNYNVGDEITLLDPTRTNYIFSGWYLDEDFNTPFTGITSSTKGDISVYAKWTPVGITITLNALDGTFAGGSSTKEYVVGFNTGILRKDIETPSSGNGEFINWFKDDSFTQPFNFIEDYGTSDLITIETTLYAKYGEAARVTYDYNDETLGQLTMYQEAGQKANKVSDPNKVGYKFGGWYLNEQKYNFDSVLTESITLKAVWYKIYTINYEGLENGTHSNPTTFTSDLEDIILKDASRPGYSFTGWYINDQRVTTIDTSTDHDITLTAHWGDIMYNLTIVNDSHVRVNNAPKTISIEGITLTATVDVGYRIKMVSVNNENVYIDENNSFFVGGFNSDVEVRITTTEVYYHDGSVNVTFKDSNDLTKDIASIGNVKQYTADKASKYYGWLVPENYNKTGYISYAIDVGNGITINSLEIVGNARVFSYENSKARLDIYYSKDGIDYELVDSLSSTTDGGKVSAISINLTQKAKNTQKAYIKYVIESGNYDWVALDSATINMTYTSTSVTFMDGDSVCHINENQVKGGYIDLSFVPTKDGYNFLGWYLDNKLREKVDPNMIVDNDLTLFAKWEAIIYNINYVVGEDADIGDNVETYTIEDNIELTEAIKKNYKFVGWYLNPLFEGEAVTEIEKGTFGDITLYAKFEKGIAVTYVLNGGENSELNPEVYFVDDEAILFDPYREGYVFGGWYLDSAFNISITSLSGFDGNPVTLYAMWIEDTIDEEDGGCGGSLISASLLTFSISFIGLTLVNTKRKEEKTEK